MFETIKSLAAKFPYTAILSEEVIKLKNKTKTSMHKFTQIRDFDTNLAVIARTVFGVNTNLGKKNLPHTITTTA